jgi:cytochrome P450
MDSDNTSTIVLNTYEDAKAALSNDDLSRSIDFELYERGNIEEGTVSVIHGLEHRDRRRIENTLFRRHNLEHYERVLFPEIVASTLDRLVTDAHSDLLEIGGLTTVVLAARIAGIDFDTTSLEQRERLREFLHHFALGGAIDAIKANNLDEIRAVKASMLIAQAEFVDEFMAASRARRELLVAHREDDDLANDDLPPDVLTLLLVANATGALSLDDALLERETIQYFTAGAHTSTQTTTNTLHLLFEWSEAHPRDRARLESDLHFVQRAVQEALRCRPTNPLIHRRAVTDTMVQDRQISEGTVVLIDTARANADPTVFGPDADRFDPYRDLPRDAPPFGTSFGGGMHMCIGRTLAVGLPVRNLTESLGPTHLYGLIPQIVQALVRRGVQPDPSKDAVPDDRTERWTRWSSYPVILESLTSGVGRIVAGE